MDISSDRTKEITVTAQYKIININLTAITSDEPISDVPCGTCSFCCKLTPYLTPEEIASGKYPLSLIQPTPDNIRDNPDVGPIVTIYRKPSGGCGMFIDGKCSIYEDRPLSCRQFDCRKGHHPSVPNMFN